MNTALSGDLSDLVTWAQAQGRREISGETQRPLLNLVADTYERDDWLDLEEWCHRHLAPVLNCACAKRRPSSRMHSNARPATRQPAAPQGDSALVARGGAAFSMQLWCVLLFVRAEHCR
jgi:hypothetical protein